MKQQILAAATLLINANGYTTTLDVKNYLHQTNSADPNFKLSQHTTSVLMGELFDEDKFTRNMVNENGFNFYHYELANVQTRPVGQVQYAKSFGLLKDSDGTVVCYVSGKPNLYVQGANRKSARKECYKLYKAQGIVWDNINTCTVKYYNNHLA